MKMKKNILYINFECKQKKGALTIGFGSVKIVEIGFYLLLIFLMQT